MDDILSIRVSVTLNIRVSVTLSIQVSVTLDWMLIVIDGQSTLVQVMVWCRQAPSHYLNQC